MVAMDNNILNGPDLQRIKKFCLFDDVFFTKCFEGENSIVEFVLKILLNKQNLRVIESRTQVFVANLIKHSVRLDVLATDTEGIKYNIEIQRAEKGAGYRRARYNSSMMDASFLLKGDDFEELPETYVIFITENDVMKKGEPLYQIERCILKTGEIFDDGAHILYINGAYRDDTPMGKLMHDFACTEPSDMYYDILAERTRFFKESKEGVAIMSKVMEEIQKEVAVTFVRRMLAAGKYSLEEIAEISGLSIDEVKHLKSEKTA